MSDVINPYPWRVAIPIAVGVLFGMSTGKAVGTAIAPSIGNFGALLVNMLTAGVVAVLITMPLIYCLKRRQTKS